MDCLKGNDDAHYAKFGDATELAVGLAGGRELREEQGEAGRERSETAFLGGQGK